MNRRNFFATIPALGALPFIGDQVEETQSGILLVKSKPIEFPPLTGSQAHAKKSIRLFLVEDDKPTVEFQIMQLQRRMYSNHPYYELEVYGKGYFGFGDRLLPLNL